MEALTLTLVALMPSIGTLIAALLSVVTILRQFKSLRADVIDESTIRAIKVDNKRLNSMYKESLEKQAELIDRLNVLAETNEALLLEIRRNQQNRED